MQPGGVNDIIAHFIGHWQIEDESARERLAYEEFSNERIRIEIDGPAAKAGLVKVVEDEEAHGRALALKNLPESETHHVGLPPAPVILPAIPKVVLPQNPVRPPEKHFDHDAGGGGGGGRAKNAIYEGGGNDRIVEADQSNQLRDNDVFLPREMHVDTGHLFQGTAQDLVHALVAADHEVPEDLPHGHTSNNELMAWASARDPEAEPHRAPTAHSQELLPGRYVNDEKVDKATKDDSPAGSTDAKDGAGTPAGETAPISVRPEVADRPVYVQGEVDVAQVAETGGNTADNAAQIVDLSGAAGTMIVVGNWFETNAIIQTNIYSDRDHVVHSGGGAGGHVETDGNVADNAAELVGGNPWTHIELPEFKGKFIHCDVVDGDFYDIKAFTQTNWLQDHDVVVQTSSTAFSVVDTGLNEQYNGTSLHEALDYYDVIIVGGNYHSANLIYQTNIVLDDDWVVAGGSGDGSDGPSIFTGQNWLFNSATIKDYGIDDATALPHRLEQLAAQIAAGGDLVDVQAAWGLAGNGSQTLNVLYISGDYFDLNLVQQINVILDSDVVVQHLPNGSCLDIPQYVSTGHNAATNEAQIVTASAIDALFVGGEHYEDSILVQAEIVIGDDDKVCQDGCSDLPPEIVAFTTDQNDQCQPDEAAVCPQPAHNDMLSNLMT